jgi:selenide,water dikinase
MDEIRLTQTVNRGGCAAKLPAGELAAFLKKLSPYRPKELAVGSETLDDACLWDCGDGRYLIQTLDFFTPIVDSPHDFGAIAAANAVSDVYAMGGTPSIALTILAFPAQKLPMELIEPLMQGALDVLNRGKIALAGGHSIDDDTLKLGFSVTGFVEKDQAWRNSGARAGDVLILTKPLGTGTITSTIKSGESNPDWVRSAIQSMTTLNDISALRSALRSVHAATDITGFGFAGHAMQMAAASGVEFSIDTKSLPVLPGALECIEQEHLNRAHYSNAKYVETRVKYSGAGTDTSLKWLTVDPQTSGGLLLSLPKADAPAALRALRDRFEHSAIVGEVRAAEPGSSVHLNFC